MGREREKGGEGKAWGRGIGREGGGSRVCAGERPTTGLPVARGRCVRVGVRVCVAGGTWQCWSGKEREARPLLARLLSFLHLLPAPRAKKPHPPSRCVPSAPSRPPRPLLLAVPPCSSACLAAQKRADEALFHPRMPRRPWPSPPRMRGAPKRRCPTRAALVNTALGPRLPSPRRPLAQGGRCMILVLNEGGRVGAGGAEARSRAWSATPSLAGLVGRESRARAPSLRCAAPPPRPSRCGARSPRAHTPLSPHPRKTTHAQPPHRARRLSCLPTRGPPSVLSPFFSFSTTPMAPPPRGLLALAAAAAAAGGVAAFMPPVLDDGWYQG